MATKTLKLTSLILVLTLIVGTFSSAIVSAQNQKLQKVTLATSPFQDTLLPIVGKELGWYEDEGLDVDIRLLSWNEAMESLTAGAADVAVNNISSVIGTYNNNPQIIYFYGMNTFDSGFALTIRPDSKWKTVEEFEEELGSHEEAVMAAAEQLRNMTVVTTGNTDMEQGVATLANMAGLDFKEQVNIIDMSPSDGLAAFLTGTGDAYIGGAAQREGAVTRGMEVMISGSDLGAPPINGYVTTKEFAKNNGDALLKLIHVWFKSVRYINSNFEEGAQIIIDRLNEKTGSNMTVENFREKYWNNYEHFLPSPIAVQNDILSPDGHNYWKDRWDSGNFYFGELKTTIEKEVPYSACWIEKAQEAYLEKYYGEDYKRWFPNIDL